MGNTIDVLIVIHGMVASPKPENHEAEYDKLWDDLLAKEERLGETFPESHRIYVEWGHDPGPGTKKIPERRVLRPDQRICYTEREIAARVTYGKLKPGPHEILLPWWRAGIPGLSDLARAGTNVVKEQIALYGLTDVVSYCSADGELAVRTAVYD